jgi:TldD protein
MIDNHLINAVLDEAHTQGADFCDLFIEKNRFQNLRVLDGKVVDSSAGIDFGIGIRLLYGDNVVYGHTNRIEKDELIRITRLLGAQYKNNKKNRSPWPALRSLSRASSSLFDFPFDQTTTQNKLYFLQQLQEAAKAQSPLIVQCSSSFYQGTQDVQIVNSQGLNVADQRHYLRLNGNVIAQQHNERATGTYSPGATYGLDLLHDLDPKQIAEYIAKQALTKLDAEVCPSGSMPVIIGSEFGGVIFHEACGHPLETSSVAKKSSVFWDKMGQAIASPVVNAFDDGTPAGLWGTLAVDDEGMPVQKTQLIKDGILTSFMVDYVGHLKTGYARTGSGRRQSYHFAPTSRMRNTYIAPGKSKLEDMIKSIDHGIYCKAMGGGSVNTATGEFNFSAQESYLIKHGKIATPLKGATLIGRGPDVIKKISMVGDKIVYSAGTCGAASGSIPVTVGQPDLKVDEILVGGGAK